MVLVYILTFVLVILAVSLIVLVLVQPDRSHGLASSFGGGASSTLFGVSEDGGPLAKLTQIVAILFVVTAILLYVATAKA